MRRSQNKVWLILSIVLLSLVIIAFASGIILSRVARNFFVSPAFTLSYALAVPVLFSAGSLCLVRYFLIKKELSNLRVENKYNFGRECSFYNYLMFAERINKLNRKHKGQQAYIIYFSASTLEITLNAERNEDATKLNNAIAEYLVSYHDSLSLKKKEDVAFCFYHGCFVIYIYGNEEDVVEFKVKLSDATSNAAKEQKLKVYSRPIFGIKLVDPEIDLYNNMDDASIARNTSERNYDESTMYSPSFRKATTKEEIEEIQDAINNNEFVVYYQPKYLLQSKAYNSAEALVRWNSKVHGLVSPGKFINKAELGGLIHELDIYVFRQVCRDLADQKKRGRKILPVSVNFSQYEFYSPSFLQDIDDVLKEFDVDPYFIQIEITEPTARKNEFMTVAIMNKLRAKGIKIAMDDYGVGYSNLANLNKMPFDTVKIDKSYIDSIVTNVKTREMVKLLISFCKANGIEVVAEGVDSADQVDILKKIKCDTIQGYYFSKPVPKAEYEKLVSKSFQALDKEDR